MVCVMADRTTEALAAATRAEIARRGVPKALVAADLGMTRQALSARLHGKTQWTAVELQRLADVLDVPVTTFLHVVREQVPA